MLLEKTTLIILHITAIVFMWTFVLSTLSLHCHEEKSQPDKCGVTKLLTQDCETDLEKSIEITYTRF